MTGRASFETAEYAVGTGDRMVEESVDEWPRESDGGPAVSKRRHTGQDGALGVRKTGAKSRISAGEARLLAAMRSSLVRVVVGGRLGAHSLLW